LAARSGERVPSQENEHMSGIHFGWADLWNFYENTNEEVQRDIIRQLSAILKSCTERMKKEVLAHAPEDVVQMLWNSITSSWSNQELQKLFRR
jgi:hypothetical protein